MKFNLWIFVVANCLLLSAAKLYITTLPAGIEIDHSISSVRLGDVSNLVSHLLGLSTGSESTWHGVESTDVFNRPKSNLLLNLHIPDELKFTLNKYIATYDVDSNNMEPLTLETTNVELLQAFSDRSPMIVYFETDGKLFNVAKLNSPFLNDIPSTLQEVRARLETSPSIFSDLPKSSCFDLSRDADAHFLGELQIVDDMLSQLSLNRGAIDDSAPDSYVFTLTAMEGLLQQYGSDSCQLKSALELLEKFVPEVISRFNNLYNQRMLSEVNVAAPIGRFFNDVAIRHTRSLQSVDGDDTGYPFNVTLGNIADMYDSDYAVVVNLTFWVMVIFALATLAASYGIWFMNPGWDSVIYRMTTQRMKFD